MGANCCFINRKSNNIPLTVQEYLAKDYRRGKSLISPEIPKELRSSLSIKTMLKERKKLILEYSMDNKHNQSVELNEYGKDSDVERGTGISYGKMTPRESKGTYQIFSPHLASTQKNNKTFFSSPDIRKVPTLKTPTINHNVENDQKENVVKMKTWSNGVHKSHAGCSEANQLSTIEEYN